MKIYLDLVVILNFMVDYLLLLGTNRLSGFALSPLRCACSAALGAAYSGTCLLRGFHFLGGPLWRAVSLGLMALTAFGWNKSALKRGGVFILLSMALGGIALSFGRGDFLAICFGAGLVWLLCRTAFGEKIGGREYIPLELTWGSQSTSLIALRDTGNSLRDPITGKPVVVIDREAARKLTGLTAAQLRDPLGTLAARPIPGLRLIPYRSVGQGEACCWPCSFRS